MDDADIDMDNSSNSNFLATFCEYLILFSSFWHDDLKNENPEVNKNPVVNKYPESRSPGSPLLFMSVFIFERFSTTFGFFY